RADFYSNWSFSWNVDPISAPANAGGPGGVPTGSAAFAATSGANGDTTIPVAFVSTTSTTTTNPDSFSNVPVTLGLTITDNATNASGTLTFAGLLNGQLTPTTSTVVGTFSLDPSSPTSLTLSGHTYQVTVDSSLALPAPGGQKLLNATV